MSATEENRRQLAVLIQSAYDGLTVDEVKRLLAEAERVKVGEVRYVLMHKRSGRRLQTEPLSFPDKQ
jgi:hypothetical protein